AGLENVHQRVPRVLDGLGDNLRQVLGIPGEAPGNEGAAVGQGQGQGVDRPFDGPLGGGAGDEALGRRGRVLALGQPVDHVVLHDVGDVDVPADGVEEVVPPDAVAIAVARHRDNV